MCGKIVNLYKVKDLQKWIQDENNIYIGRRTKELQGSKWGNPYKIQKPGDRIIAVLLYKRYLQESGLLNCIDELKGKTLGCWCAPKLCHGVILHQQAGNTAMGEEVCQSDEKHAVPVCDIRITEGSVCTMQKKRRSITTNCYGTENVQSEGLTDKQANFLTDRPYEWYQAVVKYISDRKMVN